MEAPRAASGFVVAIVALLLAGSVAAEGANAPRGARRSGRPILAYIDACMALPTCLVQMRADIGATEDRHLDGWCETYTALLYAFGNEAKQEILAMALGSSARERMLAGCMLSRWPDIDAGDVPALRAALVAFPASQAARALAREGSAQAGSILVEHYIVQRDAWPTMLALRESCLPVVGRLFDAVDRRQIDRQQAYEVIHAMPCDLSSHHEGWVRLVADASAKLGMRRLAAQSLRYHWKGAALYAPQLRRTAARTTDPELKRLIEEALTQMGDVSRVRPVLDDYRNAERDYSAPIYGQLRALQQLALQGSQAGPAGLRLQGDLNAADPRLRAAVALTLGYVRDVTAVAPLAARLEDDDWRVAAAAAKALGVMRAAPALPRLRNASQSHWAVPVRVEAANAIERIVRGVHKMTEPDYSLASEYPEWKATPQCDPPRYWTLPDGYRADDLFSPVTLRPHAAAVPREGEHDAVEIGSDRFVVIGEAYTLVWRRDGKRDRVLVERDARSMTRLGTRAVLVTLSGARLVKVVPDKEGWRVVEQPVLVGDARRAAATLTGAVFIDSGNSAFVVDANGVRTAAACDGP